MEKMSVLDLNEFCKQCDSELFDDYCSHCGTPKKLNRINGQYILSELESVLNFDKGILFTIRNF